MGERAILRERLAAIDSAIEAIEGIFGDLTEQFDTAGEPEVSAVVFHGWPDDVLANDAKLQPWQVFCLLRKVREAYARDILGPAERAPTMANSPHTQPNPGPGGTDE